MRRLASDANPALSATPALAPLIPLDRQDRIPLYRQIYGGLRTAIVERLLRPGQRLPSTRALADELGVSRISVLEAFEQLTAEGYCEGRVGRGTFIAELLPRELASRNRASSAPEPPGPRPIAPGIVPADEPWLRGTGAFRMSHPAVEHFPMALWARLVARHASNPKRRELFYGDALGLLALRGAVADYLRTARAVRCEPEQIMITSGSQQAIEIAARVLLEPGSAVWIEEPGHGEIREPLRRAGGRLVTVPVDQEGLDVAAGIAREPQARAVYLTPSHQFPLGVTMTAARRLQVLAWARRAGAWILEDDYDSEFRYTGRPLPCMQGLEADSNDGSPSRVLYVGTFSKTLVSGLRLGYMVVPDALIEPFRAARSTVDRHTPTIHQQVLADFIGEGHYFRHIRHVRSLCAERQAVLVDAVASRLRGAMTIDADPAGLHVLGRLAPGLDDVAAHAAAMRRGVRSAPLSGFYVGQPAPATSALVLGYGGFDEPQTRRAVDELAIALESIRSA